MSELAIELRLIGREIFHERYIDAGVVSLTLARAADRIEVLEAALRLRDALIEAADDLYAAYAGFARTDGQHEAMSNFSTASNTYRTALAPEQGK